MAWRKNLSGYSLFADEAVLTPRGDRPKPEPELLRNGADVLCLYRCTYHTGEMQKSAPYWMLKVLEHDAWRKFAMSDTYEQFEYADLDTFAKAEPPGGLGRKGGIHEVRAICEAQAKLPEMHELALTALRKLDQLIPQPKTHEEAGAMGGRGKKAAGNTRSFSRDGVTRAYALSRLKRDAPELAEQVMAGQISANAAAIQAGFRKRMIQIPATVEGFARAALTHLNAQERQELKDQL